MLKFSYKYKEVDFMKKMLCFMLCISLFLGLSLGCAVNSDNSQSESLKESQAESLNESEQESITESEQDSIKESESETQSVEESEQESESVTEESPTPKGLLSLQEAFDLGILTHEDLLSIAYYSGSAEINEEIDGDFEPSARPEMAEDVVLDITNSLSYVFNYLDLIPNETTENDFSVIGCYAFVNGYYVLNYDCSLFAVTTDVKTEIVGGVRFEYTHPIEVVQQKKMFMISEAKKAYAEMVIYTEPNVSEVGVFIGLYGVFGDCIVGLFETGNDHIDVAVKVIVEGFVFYEGSSRFLLVWKDGELARLNWAYENEWITVEDVAQAHETYRLGKGEKV